MAKLRDELLKSLDETQPSLNDVVEKAWQSNSLHSNLKEDYEKKEKAIGLYIKDINEDPAFDSSIWNTHNLELLYTEIRKSWPNTLDRWRIRLAMFAPSVTSTMISSFLVFKYIKSRNAQGIPMPAGPKLYLTVLFGLLQAGAATLFGQTFFVERAALDYYNPSGRPDDHFIMLRTQGLIFIAGYLVPVLLLPSLILAVMPPTEHENRLLDKQFRTRRHSVFGLVSSETHRIITMAVPKLKKYTLPFFCVSLVIGGITGHETERFRSIALPALRSSPEMFTKEISKTRDLRHSTVGNFGEKMVNKAKDAWASIKSTY